MSQFQFLRLQLFRGVLETDKLSVVGVDVYNLLDAHVADNFHRKINSCRQLPQENKYIQPPQAGGCLPI